MKPKCESRQKKRMCYCGSSSPERRAGLGVPDGFCGICERCGTPGHTQHFPGPVPYTGSWCDRCVRIVAFTWIFRSPLVLLILVILAVLVFMTITG